MSHTINWSSWCDVTSTLYIQRFNKIFINYIQKKEKRKSVQCFMYIFIITELCIFKNLSRWPIKRQTWHETYYQYVPTYADVKHLEAYIRVRKFVGVMSISAIAARVSQSIVHGSATPWVKGASPYGGCKSLPWWLISDLRSD